MEPDHASTDSGEKPVGTGLPGRPGRRRRAALLAVAAAVAVGAGWVVAVVSADDVPDGWEARSFHGMTFAVPPGARTADEIEDGDRPTFTWNGPSLGHDDAYALVSIMITGSDGDIPAEQRVEPVTVPGAMAVRSGIGPVELSIGSPDSFQVTHGGVQLFTEDAVVLVGIRFPAGPVGERMAEDLIASIDVTELEPPG